jgi:hypothetical protein
MAQKTETSIKELAEAYENLNQAIRLQQLMIEDLKNYIEKVESIFAKSLEIILKALEK